MELNDKQCQKFVESDPELYQLILNAESIDMIHLLGQNTENIRSDWFSVNREIYYKGQKAKFEQHSDLKKVLLATKGKVIRCIDSDTFWGLCINHNSSNDKLIGQNNSGKILTRIREELLSINEDKSELIKKIDETIQFLEQ